MSDKILVVGNDPIHITDRLIEYARLDLASGMGLTKMRMLVEERLKTEGKDFDEEFDKWKKREDEKKMSGNMDIFIDMARPNSGCNLAADMDIVMFKGLFELSDGNICPGCIERDRCAFQEKRTSLKKAASKARFGTHDHKTNATYAAEMGVSKRQVAKLRKRGEL